MRAREFIIEEQISSEDANLLTVINSFYNEVKSGNLEPKQPMSRVLRYLKNSGLDSYSAGDIINANDRLPALKTMVKNITPEEIIFADSDSGSSTNDQEYAGSVDNPEEIVSNMAKKALNRRRD